ncbi:MAG TPA: hypothetical protein VLR92_08925 [Blastocatellia bacterium]|nr:hypothetical protein [Blastocatellia bacterium]
MKEFEVSVEKKCRRVSRNDVLAVVGFQPGTGRLKASGAIHPFHSRGQGFFSLRPLTFQAFPQLSLVMFATSAAFMPLCLVVIRLVLRREMKLNEGSFPIQAQRPENVLSASAGAEDRFGQFAS